MLVVINKDSLMRGGLCGRGDAMGALGGHAPWAMPPIRTWCPPKGKGNCSGKIG